jgi:hypothetical protein
MGVVVTWPGASAGPRRRPLAADEPAGTILLFTGVRYERHAEAAPETPKGKGGRRSRQRA